jgi:hypothetical protein
MKGIVLISLIIVINLFSCTYTFSQHALAAENIFALSYGKWKLSDTIKEYNPDNLYDYIDGAADNYLSFNFTGLLVRTYEIGADDYITVEIYNHKSLEQAFGIFASERPTNANIEKIGAQGYQQDEILNFYTGPYYIKLSTHNKKQETPNTLKTIALDLCTKLGNDNSIPEALSFFPVLNKIPNSESFTNSNFLGHEFLKSAFIASYSKGKKIFKVFLMVLPTMEEAKEVLSNYAAYTKMDFKGQEGQYNLNDPHNGIVALEWNGKYIWGLLNDQNVKIREDYLLMVKNAIVAK